MGEVGNGGPSHSDADLNPLSTAPGESTEFPGVSFHHARCGGTRLFHTGRV